MEEGPFKGRAQICLGFPGSQRKEGASIRYKTKSIPGSAVFIGIKV